MKEIISLRIDAARKVCKMYYSKNVLFINVLYPSSKSKAGKLPNV